MTDDSMDAGSPAARVVRTIRRLTAVVRGEWRFDDLPDPSLDGEGGWWVLAVGEPYGRADFDARDQARDRLRQSVTRCGVEMSEFVWVWDETDRAQLVLATLPGKQRAERLAERYRARGLSVRVVEADLA